jgi:hypothetical protein
MQIDRVLVAGDSAHLVSPFGARGLNSGVQDAENAAWKVAFALNGWGGEGLLESYGLERLAAARENIAVTTATMDFLVPQSDQDLQHRLSVLERAVTDPAARDQVDSGRLAEPFWYVDSPLTTPNPEREFIGRPPRGHTPPVVPGVLLPDVPITLVGEPDVTRLRQVARSGLLILLTEGVDVDSVSTATGEATQAPYRILRLADIDPNGWLSDALDARPGEAWLIRPDAHVAAVLTDVDDNPRQLSEAVTRALGSPVHIFAG